MDAKRARIRAELEAQGLSPEEIEEVLMDMDADEEE
jgi:SOS response regulatory protein OraA/RecX